MNERPVNDIPESATPYSAAHKFRDLKKSATDKKIAGVCGGFGEYTPLPSWMWRVFFLVSLFLGGVGLIFYVILWICMPPAQLQIGHERVVNPDANFHSRQ